MPGTCRSRPGRILGLASTRKERSHRPAARAFTGLRGGRITMAVLRDATHWDEVVNQRPQLRLVQASEQRPG